MKNSAAKWHWLASITLSLLELCHLKNTETGIRAPCVTFYQREILAGNDYKVISALDPEFSW
jgi:hypothetical protein